MIRPLPGAARDPAPAGRLVRPPDRRLRRAVFCAGLGLMAGPGLVHGQVVRRVKDAVKESVSARAAATEDAFVLQWALLADSLAAMGLAPVDSLLVDIGDGANAAVTFVVSAIDGAPEDDRRRLEAALEAGQVDLAGVFLQGTAEVDPESDPIVQTLATLIVGRGEPVLLEAFGDPAGDEDLSARRVRAGRLSLMAFGVPAQQILAVDDVDPTASSTPQDPRATAPPQLRIRPLR